ncbi:MAG: hypothetical protein LKH74_07805 [Levilactobacillus sp.]|jgi:hypothetical protein|uniref:hypothetical protein n=1 Tax=Levilactobacillus sp. TaxID=2767919 RepID=UPI00258957C7|nr:hypothetical protein [Levilactobacillus sp.]MCH4123722.1 hypothetical protein [Levilactobacillus sp.]MCI1553820.1 hypothetical protein [Levilactobacillus sp.]MCI1599098.1 hypothetical protein [Levilactobacillus sp.]MCI1606335.1 hypothetical protein [Levilactobacillus sp.]
MKLKQIATILLTVVTLGPVMTVPANASTKVLPKKMRGTWVIKPQYNSPHHVKKNMWCPKLKMHVYKKSATWQMKGYLPDKMYDHKTHKVHVVSYSHGSALLGGDTLFTKRNFFSIRGKTLDLGWEHGGDMFLHRAK